MRIRGKTYIPDSLVAECISQRALVLVRGVDGRDPGPAMLSGLAELAGVAEDLALLTLADRLAKLIRIVEGQHCRDIERAALICLTEVVK